MGNHPPPSTPPLPPGNPALANLPPNILALLQSAQRLQLPLPQARGQDFASGMSLNAPTSAGIGSAQQSPGGANSQYQQLMAYLGSLTLYRKSTGL